MYVPANPMHNYTRVEKQMYTNFVIYQGEQCEFSPIRHKIPKQYKKKAEKSHRKISLVS